MSVWRIDINCTYIFMFPLNKLACKRCKSHTVLMKITCPYHIGSILFYIICSITHAQSFVVIYFAVVVFSTLCFIHYNGVIMSAMTAQITGVSIVYSHVCPGAEKRKHQSSTSLAFVRGTHQWPFNSPHKGQ